MTTAARSGNGESWYALVADDDEDCRLLVAAILRRAEILVYEAANGEELIERYRALESLQVHRLIVVSDIGMPGMDGIVATRKLRSFSAQLPIVLVTGFTDPGTAALAREAGANMILPKPITADALLSTLEPYRA